MKHRLAAGVIVEHESKVLVVRHFLPGRYNFWVAPGGGVQGAEELAAAAAREVREESGLEVEVTELVYIEELVQPELRQCKFWFTGRLVGGVLSAGAPEARAEHIVEAAWLSRSELQDKTVFPLVLAERYWEDRAHGFGKPVHLGLRHMEFW